MELHKAVPTRQEELFPLIMRYTDALEPPEERLKFCNRSLGQLHDQLREYSYYGGDSYIDVALREQEFRFFSQKIKELYGTLEYNEDLQRTLYQFGRTLAVLSEQEHISYSGEIRNVANNEHLILKSFLLNVYFLDQKGEDISKHIQDFINPNRSGYSYEERMGGALEKILFLDPIPEVRDGAFLRKLYPLLKSLFCYYNHFFQRNKPLPLERVRDAWRLILTATRDAHLEGEDHSDIFRNMGWSFEQFHSAGLDCVETIDAIVQELFPEDAPDKEFQQRYLAHLYSKALEIEYKEVNENLEKIFSEYPRNLTDKEVQERVHLLIEASRSKYSQIPPERVEESIKSNLRRILQEFGRFGYSRRRKEKEFQQLLKNIAEEVFL
jgi:hypothetical protein